MVLVQINFLLCLLLVKFGASEKPTDRPNGEDLPQNHFSRLHYPGSWLDTHIAKKVGNTIDLKTKCFCVIDDPSNPKVSQLLHFRGNSLKRLVVYLYQDEHTGTIKMHIPNRDKQKMLPDLAFDPNDVIAPVTNELVSELVQSNNSINVPNAIPQHQTQLKNKIPNMRKINQYGKIKPKLFNAFKHTNSPKIHSGSQYGPSAAYETTTNHAVRKTNFNIVKSVLDKVQQNKISVDNKIPNYGDDDEGANSYGIPIRYDSITSTGLPFNDGDTTFDDWFASQIDNVRKQGTLHHNSINLSTIKNLIKNTLHQNGITITKSGTLLDSENSHMDMANLKLRIVLIGKPTNFDSIINGIGTHNMLPTDVPYLEAFFLNLVRPWKILGVIPLGVILIPNGVNQAKSYKKLEIDYGRPSTTENNLQGNIPVSEVQLTNDIKDAKETPLEHEEQTKYPYEMFVEGRQGNDYDIWQKEYEEPPMYLNREAEETMSTDNENLNNTEIDSASNSVEEPPPSPTSGLTRLINSRRYNNHHYVPDTDSLMLWNAILENSKDFTINNGNHHRHNGYDGSYDELPNFRIIGGFPATSSGTPLRVKGRLGILNRVAASPEEST